MRKYNVPCPEDLLIQLERLNYEISSDCFPNDVIQVGFRFQKCRISVLVPNFVFLKTLKRKRIAPFRMFPRRFLGVVDLSRLFPSRE